MLIKTMFGERLPHISCVFPPLPLYFCQPKTDFVSRAEFPVCRSYAFSYSYFGSVTIFQPCDRMNERRACDSSGSANAGQNCTGHAGAKNEWKVQATSTTREKRVEKRRESLVRSFVSTPSWARQAFINKGPKNGRLIDVCSAAHILPKKLRLSVIFSAAKTKLLICVRNVKIPGRGGEKKPRQGYVIPLPGNGS